MAEIEENIEGETEWTDELPKPTWEQIVAMQKQSAALRARAAAVLPALPSGPLLRTRRPASRNEYPLFVPSYKDSVYAGSISAQDLGNPARKDSFRGRLLERRSRSNSVEEIVPAESSNSANNLQPAAVQRHGLSNRRSHALSNRLSPELSQTTGLTPKSTVSVKSDRNLLGSPSSIPSRNLHTQEDPVRKLTNTPGEPSSRVDLRTTGTVADIGIRKKGNHTDTTLSAENVSWKGCTGSLSMVAPFADGASATGSGMDSPHLTRRPQVQQPSDRPRAHQQAGLFGFLPWGKKVATTGNPAADRRKASSEKESNKSLEKMIKDLQKQLEQTQKKASAVRELQAALKNMEEKFQQLQSHCRYLELQIRKQPKSAGPSMIDEDDDEDEEGSSSEESDFARVHVQISLPHPKVTPEVFVRIYNEAVVSIKNLSRAICLHIREMGESASQVITTLLENHAIARGRMRRSVKILYFESFLNQVMFQTFENVTFEPSGGALVLDPKALQHVSFQAFKELQDVTWLDIEQTLDEQGVIVNHSFHEFFVARMEIVLNQLGDIGETNMPGSVISAFFEAIKAVWLLHDLSFSFRPAATILRVSQGAKFDARYMEQVHHSDKDLQATSVVLMINPGFLLDNWVVKCRVLSSSK